jgi:hypothetical protein
MTTTLSRISVRSSTDPAIRYAVTVNRATGTATSCTCPAGIHSRDCKHKRRVQRRVTCHALILREWPDCKIRQWDDETCRCCGGEGMAALLLRPRCYQCVSVCADCGVTERVRGYK